MNRFLASTDATHQSHRRFNPHWNVHQRYIRLKLSLERQIEYESCNETRLHTSIRMLKIAHSTRFIIYQNILNTNKSIIVRFTSGTWIQLTILAGCVWPIVSEHRCCISAATDRYRRARLIHVWIRDWSERSVSTKVRHVSTRSTKSCWRMSVIRESYRLDRLGPIRHATYWPHRLQRFGRCNRNYTLMHQGCPP